MILGLAAAASSAVSPSFSGATSLVDTLGWAASDREVAGILDRLSDEAGAELGPTLHAVEATLTELGGAERRRTLLEIREAVVWRNDTRHAAERVDLQVFPNGLAARADAVWIAGVWIDNRAAEYELVGDRLTIAAPTPIRPGRSARVLLQLAEVIPRFDPRGRADDARGAFGLADDAINLAWFVPSVLAPDAAADSPRGAVRRPRASAPAAYHVVLTVPADYAVASTGIAVEDTVEGAARTVVAVAAGARGFSAALVPAARVVEDDVDGVRVRVLTRDVPELAEELAGVVRGALGVYTDRFGAPTVRELEIVEAPLAGLRAAGLPGLVLVDLLHQGRAGHLSAGHEGDLARAVARQWWGEDVGNDPIREPWLDEALSAWSTSVYWEAAHGPDDAQARFEYEVVDRIVALHAAGQGDLPVDGEAWRYTQEQYAALVGGGGAAFLHHARAAANDDDRFFAALRRYHARYAGRRATAADLLGALGRAVPHRTLEALSERWIRQPGAYAPTP